MDLRVFSQQTGLCNNAYVLSQDGLSLVVDPSFMVEDITKYLEQNKLRLVGILLTHAHFDHMGEGQKLADRYGVEVHVSEADKVMFDYRLLSKWREYDPSWRVSFFKEEPVIEGFKVRVERMAGHSPGSVGFAIDKYFFTGDSVLEVHLGPDTLPCSSPVDFDKTIRHFMSLPDEWIIMPGHYGYGKTLAEVKRTNPELLARLKRIA